MRSFRKWYRSNDRSISVSHGAIIRFPPFDTPRPVKSSSACSINDRVPREPRSRYSSSVFESARVNFKDDRGSRYQISIFVRNSLKHVKFKRSINSRSHFIYICKSKLDKIERISSNVLYSIHSIQFSKYVVSIPWQIESLGRSIKEKERRSRRGRIEDKFVTSFGSGSCRIIWRMLLQLEILHQGDYASKNVRRLYTGYFVANRTSIEGGIQFQTVEANFGSTVARIVSSFEEFRS